MTQLLTDNEISTVVHNIDCGEVRPFDIEFARAIESAVLAKLREQEPVAEVSAGTFVYWANEKVPKVGTKLFTHPTPIPEGWRCPVCNTDLKHEHAYNCVAAARSE